MHKIASVGLLGAVTLLVGCHETVVGDGAACVEHAIPEVTFNPPLEGAGRYEFTLNIDGEKGTCSGEITASGSEDMMCSQGDWDISQTLKGKPGEGGAFSTIEPIPPTDITGITIHEPEAPTTVNITVKRDDKVIVEGEFPFKSRDVENSCGTTTEERNAEIELGD